MEKEETAQKAENNRNNNNSVSLIEKQNRITYRRKRKESKMGEFLILENHKGSVFAANSLKFKKMPKEKLDEMNSLLEKQKRIKSKKIYL